MYKIVKNKYLNGILVIMLFSAAIHMIILPYFAINKQDLYVLNYFNILDLDVLFPNIFTDNLQGNLLALLVVAVIYLLILKFSPEEKNGAGE